MRPVRIAFSVIFIALIAALPNAVDRDLYGARAAEKAGVRREAFQDDVARQRKRRIAEAKRKQDRAETAPLRSRQPRSRELRFDNPRSAAAEMGVINLLYRFPERFGSLPLTGDRFSAPPLGRLYDALTARLRSGRSVSVAVLGEEFSPEELSLLTDIIHHDDVTPSTAENAMRDYIKTIQEENDKASQTDDLREYAERLKQRKGYGGKDGT